MNVQVHSQIGYAGKNRSSSINQPAAEGQNERWKRGAEFDWPGVDQMLSAAEAIPVGVDVVDGLICQGKTAKLPSPTVFQAATEDDVYFASPVSAR